MRATGARWVSLDEDPAAYADLWATKPEKTRGGGYRLPDGVSIGHLACDLFPSVGRGECYEAEVTAP